MTPSRHLREPPEGTSVEAILVQSRCKTTTIDVEATGVDGYWIWRSSTVYGDYAYVDVPSGNPTAIVTYDNGEFEFLDGDTIEICLIGRKSVTVEYQGQLECSYEDVNIRGTENEKVFVDPQDYGNAFELNAENNWSAHIDDLPGYDDFYLYSYSVRELDESQLIDYELSDDRAVINNMLSRELIVQKQWKNDVEDAEHPEITALLKRYCGDVLDESFTPITIKLNESNGWTWSSNSLVYKGTDGEGKPVTYTYRVEETTSLPLYTVSYDDDGNGTLTIINERRYFELPETGGSGTTPYTATGILLMAAAIILLRRRRKSA